jgi:NhaA family Na+:H+ antiporter
MELKLQVIDGHLSDLRRASLPAIAALGGLLTPAAIYAAFNWSDSIALNGWAIPTATDIAFALGVVSLLGERVPPALRAFLLSVAIFDDLGAIVVIALFYTAELSIVALMIAALFLFGLLWLNRAGVMKPAAYFLLGIALWVAVLKSGVHATLAGVALAMFIPLRVPPSSTAEPLLPRLEHALHPWVAFGILPLFAFVNAGVPLTGLSVADLFQPVPLGIIVGLFAGKQIGIMAASALAVALGIAALPEGVRWPQLYGTAVLCGIGFTMSLFIASLAFEQGSIADVGLERLGIVAGSLLAGVSGYLAFRFFPDR